MTDSEIIDQYIQKHEHWREELTLLRNIINTSELKEEVKWGAPAYTLNKKIVLGLGAFKNHMGIWFHQGVFLKDVQQKLVNAQEGKTKALRQWRIEKGYDIDKNMVLAYVQEAIENSLAGKEVKHDRKKKTLNLPPLLKTALVSDSKLAESFYTLSPGKQRDYAEHIDSAKREATKQSRLEKIIPMILEGKGLHDKYKNC